MRLEHHLVGGYVRYISPYIIIIIIILIQVCQHQQSYTFPLSIGGGGGINQYTSLGFLCGLHSCYCVYVITKKLNFVKMSVCSSACFRNSMVSSTLA